MWEPELVYKGLELLMYTMARARLSVFKSTNAGSSSVEAEEFTVKAAALRASIETMLLAPKPQ